MNKTIWIDKSIYLIGKTGVGMYILMLTECLRKLNNIKYNFIELKMKKETKRKSIWLTLWHNTFVYIKTLVLKPDAIIFPCSLMPYFTVLQKEGGILILNYEKNVD